MEKCDSLFDGENDKSASYFSCYFRIVSFHYICFHHRDVRKGRSPLNVWQQNSANSIDSTVNGRCYFFRVTRRLHGLVFALSRNVFVHDLQTISNRPLHRFCKRGSPLIFPLAGNYTRMLRLRMGCLRLGASRCVRVLHLLTYECQNVYSTFETLIYS